MWWIHGYWNTNPHSWCLQTGTGHQEHDNCIPVTSTARDARQLIQWNLTVHFQKIMHPIPLWLIEPRKSTPLIWVNCIVVIICLYIGCGFQTIQALQDMSGSVSSRNGTCRQMPAIFYLRNNVFLGFNKLASLKPRTKFF
jgi:hypothetical protein